MTNENLLTIDDDSVVSYRKSMVSNTFEHKISLSDLWVIFQENPEDIYQYNTIDCFSLILKSGKEISLFECQRYKDSEIESKKDPIRFYKMSDTTFGDIIIFADVRFDINSWKTGLVQDVPNEQPIKFKWTYQTKSFEELAEDFSGYENTLSLLKEKPVRPGDKSMLAYCQGLKKTYNGYDYIAYVPSFGQMMKIYEYFPLLNYINNTPNYKLAKRTSFWTSTKEIADVYWTFKYVDDGAGPYATVQYATDDCALFPLYKQIKVNNEDE